MREPHRDKERLLHIKDAIERIKEGTILDDAYLIENSLQYFGVVKLIEIIGEAVYMLSKDFKDSHSDTPWRQIERMRHVLVHGYYTVGMNFIKEVVTKDIPSLEIQINLYLQQYH